MQALNLALGGSMPDFVSGHAAGVKREIFLSPGGKVSHSIGGSGWVNVPCAHSRGLKAGDIAPGLLASAYARDGVIEAIEQPGRRFVIGVQWPLHSLSELPRGFDNLLMAFADQTSAGPQPAR
jgi:gamma-glutamyl-gamma-aminobutyrate hydrolase PuuD